TPTVISCDGASSLRLPGYRGERLPGFFPRDPQRRLALRASTVTPAHSSRTAVAIRLHADIAGAAVLDTVVQVPRLPARLHDSPGPSQGVSQHTLSTQNLEVH